MTEDEETTLREDSITWKDEWRAAVDEMTEGRLPSKREFANGLSMKLYGRALTSEGFIEKVEEEKGEEKAEEVRAIFDRFSSNKRNPTREEILGAIGHEERVKWKNNWKASFGIGFKE